MDEERFSVLSRDFYVYFLLEEMFISYFFLYSLHFLFAFAFAEIVKLRSSITRIFLLLKKIYFNYITPYLLRIISPSITQICLLLKILVSFIRLLVAISLRKVVINSVRSLRREAETKIR